MSYFGVITINPNECIGTSLSTINQNDTLLDNAIHQLSATVTNLNISVQQGLSEPALGLGKTGYSVANGMYYTSNTIYRWGNSARGNSVYDSNAPTPETFMGDYMLNNPSVTITKVYNSLLNSFVLLSNGQLWGTGYAEQWQNVRPAIGSNYSGTYLNLNIGALSGKTVIDFDASELENQYVTIGVITSENRAYAWGYNRKGQTGAAASLSVTTPTEIVIAGKTIVQISIGRGGGASSSSSYGGNIFVRTSDGLLYACGENSYGQLGINSTTDATVFTQCRTESGVITGVNKIFDSGSLNGGLTKYVSIGGQVWATGYNAGGQLADGGTVHSKFFKRVGTLTDIDQLVTAGDKEQTSVVARKTDGTVWAWGYNAFGVVGFAGASIIKTPTQITVYKSDIIAPLTTTLPFISKIFGSNNSGNGGAVALISDTKLAFVAGSNVFGSITMLGNGSGSKSTNIYQQYEKVPLLNVEEVAFYCRIATATDGSQGDVRGVIARDSAGAVWVWGYNDSYIVHPSNQWTSTNQAYYNTPRTINKY